MDMPKNVKRCQSRLHFCLLYMNCNRRLQFMYNVFTLYNVQCFSLIAYENSGCQPLYSYAISEKYAAGTVLMIFFDRASSFQSSEPNNLAEPKLKTSSIFLLNQLVTHENFQFRCIDLTRKPIEAPTCVMFFHFRISGFK